MLKPLVFVIGTSRPDGNTHKLLHHVNQKHNAPIIDLCQRRISYFDYEHRNSGDDFIPTIEEILHYRTIGLVSPLYWYTVSAQMKTFIDRWSDLLSIRKDLGQALKGKNTFLIATGSEEDMLPLGMEETIRLSSMYMEMVFRGSFYAKVETDHQFLPQDLKRATQFVDTMFEL